MNMLIFSKSVVISVFLCFFISSCSIKNSLTISGGKLEGNPKSKEGAKFYKVSKIEWRLDKNTEFKVDHAGDTTRISFLNRGTGVSVGTIDWICVCGCNEPLADGTCVPKEIVDYVFCVSEGCTGTCCGDGEIWGLSFNISIH